MTANLSSQSLRRKTLVSNREYEFSNAFNQQIKNLQQESELKQEKSSILNSSNSFFEDNNKKVIEKTINTSISEEDEKMEEKESDRIQVIGLIRKSTQDVIQQSLMNYHKRQPIKTFSISEFNKDYREEDLRKSKIFFITIKNIFF